MRIRDTSDATFARDVLKTNGKTVVLFYAQWAGPSRQIQAPFEDAAYGLRGQAVFWRLDIENNPVAAREAGIKGVPTVIVYEGGVPILMKLGAGDTKTILEWLAEAGIK